MNLVSVLLPALALLPAAAAPAAPELLPAEQPRPPHHRAHMHYEELPQEFTENLRRACRNCATVRFDSDGVRNFCGKSLTIPRGAALNTLLEAIAAQPRWYTRIWDKRFAPGLGSVPGIYFADAAGELLFQVEIWPGGPAYAKLGEEYISLWEFCRRHLPPPATAKPIISRLNKVDWEAPHKAITEAGLPSAATEACLDCEPGENTYTLLRDVGSGMYVWCISLCRRDEQGRWVPLAEDRFSTPGLLDHVSQEGELLHFLDKKGRKLHSIALPPPAPPHSHSPLNPPATQP